MAARREDGRLLLTVLPAAPAAAIPGTPVWLLEQPCPGGSDRLAVAPASPADERVSCP